MKAFQIILSILTVFAFNPNIKSQEVTLNKGDKAPNFTAVDEAGIPWSLKSHLGAKTIVLYFYPAAMTGGCTKQACAYRDMKDQFDSEDVIIVGISGDKPENLQVFKKAHQLNFTLLSDGTGAIASLYGVPTKEGGSISREINGANIELSRDVTTRRWTFIIDKDGFIEYIDKEVDAANDSKQVFEFLQSNIPESTK